jgi:hypothetical protein
VLRIASAASFPYASFQYVNAKAATMR